MTVCSECGGPLDADTIHVHHTCDDIECPTCHGQGGGWIRLSADDWDWEVCPNCDHCDCPEVCASCCTDPGCALRPDQETPMTDSSPAPLEPGEVAVIKACIGQYTPSHIARLVATVEQVRRERDAAHAAIRRYEAGWEVDHYDAAPEDEFWRHPLGTNDEPMTPGEIAAIRRARAVPGAENETTDG